MAEATPREPTAALDRRFSSPGADPRPWSEVLAVIQAAEIFWLSTVRHDGRPHVTPLPAMWLDGGLHFCTGREEQKHRNLDRNPQCALTTGTDRFLTGLDVVVEGTAAPVTDREPLTRLARMWQEKLEWTFEVVDGGFRDPQLGDQPPGPTATVFRLEPAKALAFGKGEPFSQTRYRF